MDVVPSNRNVNCSRQKKKKKLSYDTQNKIKIRLRESKSEMIHSITELHAETIQYSQQTTIKISNWHSKIAWLNAFFFFFPVVGCKFWFHFIKVGWTTKIILHLIQSL